MGMTGDFEAAVEEGATLVRIGTAIFGKRDFVVPNSCVCGRVVLFMQGKHRGLPLRKL